MLRVMIIQPVGDIDFFLTGNQSTAGSGGVVIGKPGATVYIDNVASIEQIVHFDKEGQKALISELRSGDFFPIHPCIELIADNVTALFDGKSNPTFEVLFDDRTILSTYVEE